eukprot:6490157-Amphidinium_carterae.1
MRLGRTLLCSYAGAYEEILPEYLRLAHHLCCSATSNHMTRKRLPKPDTTTTFDSSWHVDYVPSNGVRLAMLAPSPWSVQRVEMAAAHWTTAPPYASDEKFQPKHSASCYCGRVAFQVNVDPLAAKICDCSACMRLHGAPCQWAVLFKKEAVQFKPSSFAFLRWYNCEHDAAYMNGDERVLPSKVHERGIPVASKNSPAS